MTPVPVSLATSSPTTPTRAVAAAPDFASLDLFELGRRATAARDDRLGARAGFARSRQLLATGAWRGPRDACESYVELTDLAALGGFAAARAAGVGLLVGAGDRAVHAEAHAQQARSLWRLPFRAGATARERHAELDRLRQVVGAGLPIWGVMPTPDGEPQGLDALHLVATLRLELPEIPHVVLDVAALGPRLAQMALGFGADELWAPIVSERALRLGGNANNPAMTRKEAAVLIRGAGLAAFERIGPDEYVEESP